MGGTTEPATRVTMAVHPGDPVRKDGRGRKLLIGHDRSGGITGGNGGPGCQGPVTGSRSSPSTCHGGSENQKANTVIETPRAKASHLRAPVMMVTAVPGARRRRPSFRLAD